jgi:hypothetical protein
VIRENSNNIGRQTFLSLIILSILIVIVAGIVIIQFRYNPAVLQKDMFSPAANKEKASAQPTANKSFIPLPQSLEPLTVTEVLPVYTVNALRINADLICG